MKDIHETNVKAPAHLVHRGWIVAIVPSGCLVQLENGDVGKVRWSQLAGPDTDFQAAQRQAVEWQRSRELLEFVVIEKTTRGLRLSHVQAEHYPWPNDSIRVADKRVAVATVYDVVQGCAFGRLPNHVEVLIDKVALDAYLWEKGYPAGRPSIDLGDEVEGYLAPVDEEDRPVDVPDTNAVLPRLKLDVVGRLRDLDSSASSSEQTGVSDAPEARIDATHLVPVITGRELRVLVVENERQPREALIRRLERRGCIVEACHSVSSLRERIILLGKQGWSPDVAFIDLDLPSETEGFLAVGMVSRQFSGCRVVVTTAKTSLAEVRPPEHPVAASALVLGILDDSVLNSQLRREAPRIPWERLAAGASSVFSESAVERQRPVPRLQTPGEALPALLRDVMSETRSDKGAVLRLHPARKELEAVADQAYLPARDFRRPHTKERVVSSCIGDVLLRRLEFAPANHCSDSDPVHANHFLLVGDYGAMISLPIDVPGPHRYGLFLLRSGAQDGGKPYTEADVEAARRVADKMTAHLARRVVSELLNRRSGLMTVGLMALNAWHDIDKNLNVVFNDLERIGELSQDGKAESEEKRNELKESSQRITRRFRNIVAISKKAISASLPAGDGRGKTPVGLLTALENALSTARQWPQCTQNRDVEVSICPHVRAEGDLAGYETLGRTDLLERVVLNLLVNAVEHAGEGIRKHVDVAVTLHVGRAPEAVRREVHRRFSQQALRNLGGSWAVITVEDTGPGIPGGIREDIFEPLFSTKLNSEEMGSGLGLPIARGLVEDELGGVLYVPRAPRFVGTTVRIVLPVRRKKRRADL